MNIAGIGILALAQVPSKFWCLTHTPSPEDVEKMDKGLKVHITDGMRQIKANMEAGDPQAAAAVAADLLTEEMIVLRAKSLVN
jgi:hypothetical protein